MVLSVEDDVVRPGDMVREAKIGDEDDNGF